MINTTRLLVNNMATTRAHQEEGRSNQTKQSKIDFHEIIIALGITLLAYIIEYLKYEKYHKRRIICTGLTAKRRYDFRRNARQRI